MLGSSCVVFVVTGLRPGVLDVIGSSHMMWTSTVVSKTAFTMTLQPCGIGFHSVEAGVSGDGLRLVVPDSNCVIWASTTEILGSLRLVSGWVCWAEVAWCGCPW